MPPHSAPTHTHTTQPTTPQGGRTRTPYTCCSGCSGSNDSGCIASGLLGPTSRLPCQPANHWNTLLRPYSGLPRAYLANQQIIGIHCFGPTRAYLGPTLPTSKSLEYIAMQSLLCNLCCAIFAVQYLLRNLCYAIFARQSLLSQSLRSYLGPTFANQQIIGIHCF